MAGKFMNNTLKRTITGIAIILWMYLLLFYLPSYYFNIFIILCGIYLLMYEMPRLVDYTKPTTWLFLIAYPIAPLFCLIGLNRRGESDDSWLPLVALFIIVFTFDTGSYIAGRLFGKHKIAPAISPGKTWEGFVGGAIISCIVTYIPFIVSLLNHTNTNAYLYSWFLRITLYGLPFVVATCIIALLGDLFESWLKRRAHIKDSGTLLPGHGGLLDRLDSVLFVAVFFYVCTFFNIV